MTAYEKLKTVRAAGRPTGSDFVNALFTDRVSLSGDRRYAEDSAILGGIGYLGEQAVTYIAIDKGHTLDERLQKHFGCPMPEGYRKALRLMKQAEKFGRPVICLVDTLGAFCGADGEERGQGQAIAENLTEMMGLKTPVISLVIGEGGSGGALALAVADRVYMLENAVYSVISPDGCASIIWKDAAKAQDAADCLHITAQDMVNFGVAENIIPEDFDHFETMCGGIKTLLLSHLNELCALSPDELLSQRYQRFRRIGIYEENGNTVK
ncbi:MAG: acetyl-CoA carboxylase carboxyl transferase subunit alpha [Clostridiales bacterium]|nr:acetyl-CoA carboxylase carboxyl transferase subunit alpha [Clostridiales bacterium]